MCIDFSSKTKPTSLGLANLNLFKIMNAKGERRRRRYNKNKPLHFQTFVICIDQNHHEYQQVKSDDMIRLQVTATCIKGAHDKDWRGVTLILKQYYIIELYISN